MIELKTNEGITSAAVEGDMASICADCCVMAVEAFKIVRHLSQDNYERMKENFFAIIISGQLDKLTETSDNVNMKGFAVEIDAEEFKKQLGELE